MNYYINDFRKSVFFLFLTFGKSPWEIDRLQNVTIGLTKIPPLFYKKSSRIAAPVALKLSISSFSFKSFSSELLLRPKLSIFAKLE